MKYLLMFAANEDEWMAMREEERAEAIARIGQWYAQNARAGTIVDGTRLEGGRSARTVLLGPAGRSRKPSVVDGPFVEAKEVIGSIAVIEADDLGAAIRVASSWPAGGKVEIRPVKDE